MNGGMEILKPKLVEAGVESIGKVVIGTVKGDLHDIGKNLVKMMMEGAGFEVIDLGVDVSAESFANVEEHEPVILGLSALLTTTMPQMKATIEHLKERGLRDKVYVMVGEHLLLQALLKKLVQMLIQRMLRLLPVMRKAVS